MQALVTAYNDASQLLTEVSDPKSTLATYGATLVGNSVVTTIRNQMRGLVTTDSSTASGSISALRDVGISIDSKGKLAINSVTLDLALRFNYSDTVTMLSGNQQDQGAFDTTVAGVAGDAFKALTTTLSSTGTLKVQSDNATKRIANYQDDLTKLQDRMTLLLARYIKQFSVMDSLVGQTNSLRTSLSSTFTGMQSIYTNK
jgi:flagellar hook-associated protein 2